MTAYVLRRLWQMIPTMAGVVMLVFLLFNWVGGDPAYVLAGKIVARMKSVGRRSRFAVSSVERRATRAIARRQSRDE